jgi:hypothetical protein
VSWLAAGSVKNIPVNPTKGFAKAAAAIEKLRTEKRDLLLRVEAAEAHIRCHFS